MDTAALSPSKAYTPDADPAFPARFERVLKTLFPRIGPQTLATFLGAEGRAYLSRAGLLATGDRLASFLAQAAVESANLTRRREDMNYSAERIVAVWPSRFDSPVAAARFARNPQALANRVYGGRNGNVEVGDGWRFRGGGYLGLTGRGNYRDVGKLLNLPLEDQPELVEAPIGALASACGYWILRDLNPSIDRGDLTNQTRRINTGLLALAERRAMFVRAQRVIHG
jgi:putative chitinase